MAKQNLETMTFKGVLTATSNKKGKFKNTESRKTAYIEVADQETKKKLVDFGLTEYTSKDGNKFFIIKTAEKVDLFYSDGTQEVADFSTEKENYETAGEVGFAILKGESEEGNAYVRIFAMQLENKDELVVKEKINPFSEL